MRLLPSKKLKRKLEAGDAEEEPTTTASSHHHSYKYFIYVLAACVGFLTVVEYNARRPARDVGTIRTASSRHSTHGTLITEAQYHLKDDTIRLSPFVVRPWLDASITVKPKVKLVLTNIGWNHESLGKAFFRSIRSREYLQAFVDHPLFDPTFDWSSTDIDPDVKHIALFDLETLFEGNYPEYWSRTPDIYANVDVQHGRPIVDYAENLCYSYDSCAPYLRGILETPLFQQNPDSKLVLLVKRPFLPLEETTRSHQISQFLVSAADFEISKTLDYGLPPPMINPITLTAEERSDICQERQYFLTFVGGERRCCTKRADLMKLNNEAEGIILMKTEDFAAHHPNLGYDGLLRQTLFAAAPRGDQLFTYRFAEVLSAGAIPVVYADSWVFPFHKDVVDWDECAVLIDEDDTLNTVYLLQSIPKEQLCRMQTKCYEIYQRYIANPEGIMAGVVESVLAMDKK